MDLGHEVLGRRLRRRDLRDHLRLVLAQLEQLLALPEQLLLQRRELTE
jgi:hypothetical protein